MSTTRNNLEVIPQDEDQLADLLNREEQLREDLAEAFPGDVGSIMDSVEAVHKTIRRVVRAFRIEGPAGFAGEVESIMIQCRDAGIQPPYLEIAGWIVSSSRPADIRDSWRSYMHS